MLALLLFLFTEKVETPRSEMAHQNSPREGSFNYPTQERTKTNKREEFWLGATKAIPVNHTAMTPDKVGVERRIPETNFTNL